MTSPAPTTPTTGVTPLPPHALPALSAKHAAATHAAAGLQETENLVSNASKKIKTLEGEVGAAEQATKAAEEKEKTLRKELQESVGVMEKLRATLEQTKTQFKEISSSYETSRKLFTELMTSLQDTPAPPPTPAPPKKEEAAVFEVSSSSSEDEEEGKKKPKNRKKKKKRYAATTTTTTTTKEEEEGPVVKPASFDLGEPGLHAKALADDAAARDAVLAGMYGQHGKVTVDVKGHKVYSLEIHGDHTRSIAKDMSNLNGAAAFNSGKPKFGSAFREKFEYKMTYRDVFVGKLDAELVHVLEDPRLLKKQCIVCGGPFKTGWDFIFTCATHIAHTACVIVLQDELRTCKPKELTFYTECPAKFTTCVRGCKDI